MSHLAQDADWNNWHQQWRVLFCEQATNAMRTADPGHGIDHVSRVVGNAERLGILEHANPFIVLPAAWLHDCVLIPKDSPERSKASRLAAIKARELLGILEYPRNFHDGIVHAIESHSFSAAIECKTIEAQVVQDADRLEALGSIGIARCLMTAGSLGQALYNVNEPFPVERDADDRNNSIDHFFAKLFRLPATMKTTAGRSEAQQRIDVMLEFLKQLANDIGEPIGNLEAAMRRISQ